MKKTIILLFFLISHSSFAESVHFDNIKVSDFATFLYGEFMRVNYVMSQDVISKQDLLKVHFEEPDHEKLAHALRRLLSDAGVEQRSEGGFVTLALSKPQHQAKEVFIYHPRFRSVAYLSGALTSAIPALILFGQNDSPIVDRHQAKTSSSASVSMAASNTKSPAVIEPLPPSENKASSSRLDLLVINGSKSDIEQAKKLLPQLDLITPEIMIKAVVYEVSVDGFDRSALGIVASLLGSKLELHAGKVTALDYSAVLKAFGGVELLFDALNTDTRFKSVSSPSLRVQSGASARLQVGSETPILGASSLDRNGNTIQSIEYKPSGVILDLKPVIFGDVTDLQVTQQISSFIPTTSGVNSSPTMLKREFSTMVGIASNDVLFVGGLDDNSNSTDRTGLDILPQWLGSKSSSSHKTEILMILQATRI